MGKDNEFDDYNNIEDSTEEKEMTQEDLKKRLGIDNPGDEVMTESKAKNFLKDLVKDSPEMQAKIEELRAEQRTLEDAANSEEKAEEVVSAEEETTENASEVATEDKAEEV